jgi:hypothetical protein
VCTILVRWDPAAPEPLIVAANRDEFRDRPADEPAELASGVFAGRDRRAGGTWLAVGARGLAAITNIAGAPPSAGRPSRGALPLAALAGTLPASFERWSAFNLLVAAADGLRVVVHPGAGASHRTIALGPGAHAIVNEPFGETTSARARRAASLLTGAVPDFRLLADHGAGDDPGLCHHGETYGTVSASLVAFDRAWNVTRYLHASGLPCRSVPRDLSADARRVARR